MASKLKQTQLQRREQYERRLKTRLALLAERGIEPARIDKDPLVRSLRAQIEATDARLKAIAAIERRTAELAKIKAERAEAEKAARAPVPEEAARRRRKRRAKKRSPPRKARKRRRRRKKRRRKRSRSKPGLSPQHRPGNRRPSSR